MRRSACSSALAPRFFLARVLRVIGSCSLACSFACFSASTVVVAASLSNSAPPTCVGASLPVQDSIAPGVVRAARVVLSGPLESARVSTSVGDLELERPLAAGETLEAWLPLPAESSAEARTARWRVEGPRDEGGLGLGRARTELVLEPHPAFGELDPALAARALPQVARPEPLGAAVVALACFAAALALALVARARHGGGLALAALVAAGGAWGAWSLRGAVEPPEVRVLEALDAAPVWLLRRAGSPGLDLQEVDGALRVLAPDARGALRIHSDGERHRLRSTGLLVVESPWVATLERLDPARNEFEPLTLVHRRQSGVWRVHGAWPMGAALPPEVRDAATVLPPWLLAGLPAGVDVWLARRADGSWLRWVGRGA